MPDKVTPVTFRPVISRWWILSVACLLIAAFKSRADDSVVVFNELMYNNAPGDDLEWIEIYNQMAVDVDISAWEITGADFTFPPGTIITGRSYLLVASDPATLESRNGITGVLGPLTSNLANGGERIRLRNHNGRIMDQLRYSDDEPWPIGPDGSGFSLAKIHVDRWSEDERNWQVSSEIGGTPGRENFAPGSATPLSIRFNEVSAGTAFPFWVELKNESSAELSLEGWSIVSLGATDALFAFPAGATLPPASLLVIAEDELGFRPAGGDRLFLFSPEKETLADATVFRPVLRGRSPTHSGRWLTPSQPTPGEENLFSIEENVVINEIMYHPRDLSPRPAIYEQEELLPIEAIWRYEQSGSPMPSEWKQPGFDHANWPAGPALLYVENSALPGPKNTPLQLGQLTYYFRSEFMFDGSLDGAEVYLEHIIDDGAVFYLNGLELHRFNMPQGAVAPDTLAASGIGEAALVGPVTLPSAALVAGRNVLAVEVHQRSSDSSDVVFGAKLGVRKLVMPARDLVESTNQWVELHNHGAQDVDLSGWTLGDATRFSFPSNTILPASGYLVVARDTNSFSADFPEVSVLGNFAFNLSRSSELLTLLDQHGNPADEVRYYDDRPWPWLPDGSGASLELRDPRAHNLRPEAWAASIDQGEWQLYTYTGLAQSDSGPTRWNEFIFGLLDAGEVLLDDFSVIENPGAGQRELLQNGGFEQGATSWRFLGTHRQAKVIDDPDQPGNKVLHLIADGSTEHMHNHVETTYAGNTSIANGRTYQVSFRAKWLSGCNKLNTRLYFNRVARTTDLAVPARFGTPGRQNSNYIENLGPTFAGLRHSPVVPNASQNVQITIQAADPDGVDELKLWSAPNGTGWVSTVMQRNGDLFTATISPKAAGTVVQFYLEATDTRGAASFYPAEGRDSRALYRVADSQGISARLHNLRLIMLPSEASALHASTNVMSNGRSLLTVIYNEQEAFYNTSLHLQASQRGRMNPERVGFTVRFPAGHLFRGVHDSITFDRSGGYSGRGGKQDEIVLRHILNQAGRLPDAYNDLVRLIAPQSTHTGTAMLLMAKHGNEYWEGIREGMDDGSLIKLELIYSPTTTVGGDPEAPKLPQPDDVTGIDLGNRGNDKEAYRWFFLMENHQERDDYRRLIELAQAFSLTGAAFEQRITELIDVSQWARVFAAKALSGDVDTYAFGLPHNHMFFFPPDAKALTLPWDMDFSWTRGTGESIYAGAAVGNIFGIPKYRRLYLGHLSDIMDRAYNTDYMNRWTSHYGTMAQQNYSGILTYIGQRAAAAKSQLPVPAQFRILSNNGQGFTTNAPVVRLQGQAPYTIERMELVGQPTALFTWPEFQTWEVDVALQPGMNSVQVVGHSFQGAITQSAINIQLLLPQSDQDGDQMPDDWETAHGLDPGTPNAGEDFDGDGLTNLEEYLAGTHPADLNSRLSLRITSEGSVLDLAFQAMAGRSYQLQYRNDTDSNWMNLLRIPAKAESELVTVRQTISPVAQAIFYRVLLEP